MLINNYNKLIMTWYLNSKFKTQLLKFKKHYIFDTVLIPKISSDFSITLAVISHSINLS